MSIKEISEQIGDLIGKDDLQGAISLLGNLLKNSPKLEEVILQTGRLNDITNQIRLGVVDFEKADITKNKIRIALLNLIEEIEVSAARDPNIKKEIERNYDGPEKARYTQNHSGTGDNVMNF